MFKIRYILTYIPFAQFLLFILLNFSPGFFPSLGFGLLVSGFLIERQCLIRYTLTYVPFAQFLIYILKLLPLFFPVSGRWSSGLLISYREAMFNKIMLTRVAHIAKVFHIPPATSFSHYSILVQQENAKKPPQS